MNGETLWAPWRGAYLRELARRAEQPPPDGDDGAGFLAEYWAHPERDEQHHVIYRDGAGLVLLNRYPYANGHLLIALGEARPTLLEYAPEQRAAFWGLVEVAMELMSRTLRPQGMNVGVNQGLAAGAGVPGHLHAHVVPRWSGDTNFITAVGQVRVIPEALETMAAQYREAVTAWREAGSVSGP